MISSLTRIFGPQRLDLAEEVVQDALVKALKLWPYRGVPDNPAAGLIQVAKNRALDLLRRETSLRAKSAELLEAFDAQEEAAREADARLARGMLDDELSMMFMACHPTIQREGRVALTLKTVSGCGVESRLYNSHIAPIPGSTIPSPFLKWWNSSANTMDPSIAPSPPLMRPVRRHSARTWNRSSQRTTVQQLSCLSRQLLFFVQLGKRKNYTRKGCWSRTIALRIVRNLRIQAVSATFLSLPRFNKCWY